MEMALFAILMCLGIVGAGLSLVRLLSDLKEMKKDNEANMNKVSKERERKNAKVEINYIRSFKDGFVIGWAKDYVGFGELTVLYNDEDDRIYMDTEGMDENFVREVFNTIVEQAITR